MTTQTETKQAPGAELGKARLRKEDERLITGQTNWTDNIVLPGMLHIAFLRSRSRTRGSPRWTSAPPAASPG
jgi:carbon-monoxide dehydrogenase large subunit